MQNIKKWIATLLAISLLLNLIPLNVLAEEPQLMGTEELSLEMTSVGSPEVPLEVTPEPFETEALQITDTPTQDDDNEISTEDKESSVVPIQEYSGFADAFANKFAGALITYGLTDENSVKNIIIESESSESKVTLKVGDKASILVLLSNQDQTDEANYCNWTIDFNITGSLVLGTETQPVIVKVPNSTDELIYQGLGDNGFPFKGNFTGNIGGFTSAYTIFKSVSAAVKLQTNASGTPTIPITWSGTQEKPILANTLVAASDEHTLNMPLASSSTFSPYIGELSGDSGLVKLSSLDYSKAKSTYNEDNTTTGNLGLVCNHMVSDTNMQINTLQISNQVDLRGSGNVGGLVGQIDSGATLYIGQTLNMNVKLEGTNAGGLVGQMREGCISFDNNINEDINIRAEVKATNAGGLIGQLSAGASTFANPKVLLNSVKTNGTENAGILYGMCTVTSAFNPFDGVTINNGATTEVSGSLNCGGVFGTLTLNGEGKCSISGEGTTSLEISSKLSTATNQTQYGGIVGTLNGDARKNALVVNKCNITSTVNVGTDSRNYPKYLGGIAAVQGSNATIDAKESIVTLSNPRTPLETYGIGGLCTEVGDGALLIADTMKIVIDSFVERQGSSGIAASTGKGTVVYLKNRLDLSEALLASHEKSGQIVGQQDSSLIYAPDVAITRLNTNSGTTSYSGTELDDIGNYGELYRIKELMAVDENYNINFQHVLSKTDEAYVLSSALDYACLALAWQSRGNFPTVNGVDVSNWNSLQSSNIKLNKDINLKDCGIGGLTRDTDKDSNNDKFSGIFDGNGNTLTLDIGAANSANTVSKGDSRIYRHNATGLFAILSSNATVNNLTLNGSIRLSNNKFTSAMYSGALAAQIKDTQSERSVLNKVSTSVSYDAIANGANPLYLGGLIGLITGANTQIDFNSGTSLSPVIAIYHSGNGSVNHIGGAIGGISTDSDARITCSGAFIGGSIVSTVSSGTFYNLCAGGLIGTIFQSSNKTRLIGINNLSINNFNLSGNANDRMGGILGGIWANADVTIDDLTVTNTQLTSSGEAAVGGLVYRASGKWAVSSAKLSGLSIDAANASALGLMVCHGEPYKELLNSTNTFTDISGLYLEMTADWESGYIVPGSITFSGTVFDEFVAYTAYRSADDNYDVTHNGSGIISLKTTGDKVNMTEGARNTYVNRTKVGQSKKTNNYSRYYYNLRSIMDSQNAFDDETINTKEELLIWSVHRYADNTLRKYFTVEGITDLGQQRIIGGTGASDDQRADFDMKGLSYYPIDISNENITVQYADVKFYNDEIETWELENKSTRGTDSEHTQHYMMHCALFRDFKAEDISATKEYTMTVNGVSFAGSAGVINEGSGALLCGTVAGQYDGRNTAICKVVLADEDSVDKAITLNTISIVPDGDYTPVLINKMDGYSTLEANYIKTTQTTCAGSSLIGKVGRENASKVTISFGGTIKLPEEEGVFTKATLFNSLQYADGSATYTFNYDKDNEKHDATHGKELTTSVEYEGKIGFYDDQETTAITPKKEGASDFTGYLPYVAFSPATKNDDVHTLEKNWHELAVNIHSYNILEGCGTYGHPYIVTEKEFREAASFVNTGKASNNWQIRMPKSNAEYHNAEGDDDEIVTYSSSDADQVKKIQEHLRNAYYRLEEDNDGKFELSNFNGIGASPETAFKGVIDGNSIAVSLTGGSSAFIKYSYGSVVRNVGFELSQAPTLTWKDPGRTSSGTTPEQQAPGTFFGGVIGCVLGGDNIIDNVTVTAQNSFKLTLTGTNAYLVPTGGYVGVIAGGGVIFRGNCSDTVDITTDYKDSSTYHIYCNPIIGRVLGGYAFYEGDGTIPNNGTDANYKINKISSNSSRDLEWDGSTLTVKSGQGLLILSAIVSSGAGSENSNAYKLGVARKANYNNIGEATSTDDYEIAKAEGNTSCLSKYVSGTGDIRKLCTSSTEGISVNFTENANFNMTDNANDYGNGYRGLSARYVSNAAFNGSNVETYMVVMRIKTFNGKNATVTGINMDVKEYANDDFHMVSMGGIFNIVWTKKQSGGSGTNSVGVFAQKLTIQDCRVSLKYFDSVNKEQVQADTTTFTDDDGLSAVTVGGFIGSVSDVETLVTSKVKTSNYLFSDIHICGSETKRCTITGPNSAGGLIGASAMTGTSLKGNPGVLLSNTKSVSFGSNFLNCSYSYVDVTGKLAAGGLIGTAYASTTVPQFGSMGTSYSDGNYCFTSCTVTEDVTVGQNSNITAAGRNGVAGGLFGIAGMRVGVNFPKVNKETELTIVDGGEMHEFSLSEVEIKSSIDSDILRRSNNEVNGPDSKDYNTASGGIIGRISHVNQVYCYDISMEQCKVDAQKQINNAYAGGIVAYGYTNTMMVVQHCNIIETKINGKYSGGFLAYGYSSSSYQFHLSNCRIEESTVYGETYSGGLVGNAASKYYFYNILIKNTSITAKNQNKAGRLFGWMNISASSDNFWVYAAGVSVYSDKENIKIPEKDGNCDTGRNYIGYIAYADYEGINTQVKNENSPYVTVNPNFTLTGANKMLTGDAVKITRTETDNVIPVASRIWEDQKAGVAEAGKLNRVPYQNISNDIKDEALPEVSTFYGVQNCGPDDLPVLVIKGGDTSVIEDYLNVITNGGYGKAKTITTDKVLTMSVSVYAYENNVFVEKTKEDLENEKAPASIYVDNGELKVLGSSYDNTRNRFSLVEATFNVTVDDQSRTYTVSVPVVVIRELQYDFMATFAYGAEFQADTFTTLDKHVLENTGNPFTGYLSYVYNREKDTFVPYEWQSYMDSGGSMLEVDKVLKFYNGLPKGTQMILIDCQNGNKAYQYKSGESINQVKLSDFTSVSDGTYFCSSMADVLGVTKSGPNENGKYVTTTNVNDAKVRLNGEYYRLYTDSDGSVERYDLTVPDLSLEKAVENYYLMITVPDQGNQNYFLNGKLNTELDWSMPNNGTQVHRYDPGTVDNGENTESSYQIYSGYQQSLESLSVTGEAINLMDVNKKMQVALKDTITFSSKQAYGDDDPLFAKFNVSLKKHMSDSADKEEIQFRAGTAGTVHFYIQDRSGQYYIRDGSTWKIVTEKSEASQYNSYEWISQGNNMELPLSANGNEALDLAWVRQTIIDNSSLKSEIIIITAEMDIEFSGQEVLNATVPASDQNGTDIWAQLHYVALLSTQASSLNYTANRIAVDDNAHYYRGIQYQAILSLDAMRIDQLGVNPLELVASYMKNIDNKEASQIELNAALNLANLPNYESILQRTKEIKFSLSLEQRSGSGYTTVGNASDYLAFAWSDGSRNWEWTISQDKFCSNGKLITSDVFRDAQFTFPLTAFVFTNQKAFANYKIKLSVSFWDENDNQIGVSVEDKDAYVVYTYACIKPTFYTPS